ncbi:MAG TPA: tRNA preQ1(34) S-adenosylmethionine ribosyltransferase-isomerase QueA [Verrucomicrobiae bacterium]|nr:tRNA preQ1(34) S-adenosylmethionine ribosyltransferase-isomerase QueA [Verrucomicrobiae bacterium]
MLTADFDFKLPPELIAQHPAGRRDESRLLVLNRATRQFSHRNFRDLLELLAPGDVLVLNNSKVIPARLHGVEARAQGELEILLLEQNQTNDWWAMVRPGKRARMGSQITLTKRHGASAGIAARVTAINEEGHRRFLFEGTPDILNELDSLGEVPLPPYITRDEGAGMDRDRERYQTVFAQPPGSVAAPTAGLHFTRQLLEEIESRGVEIAFVTLHVGPGTFAPVKADLVTEHKMHEERFEISASTAGLLNRARASGRRIIAVGTTTLRVLESAAAATSEDASLRPGPGRTRIFIHPPFLFKMAGALLTNFHLPRSTLLMLVSAFAAPGELSGRDVILAAYDEAVRQRYRFFSYGDAMFIA